MGLRPVCPRFFSASPQSWNGFAYVGNNPVNALDPEGLDCIYPHSNGGVEVLDGDCRSDTDDGIFVDGKVDPYSFSYDPNTDTLSFSFTNTDTGTFGRAVVGDVGFKLDTPLNPYAQALFQQPVWGVASRSVDNYLAKPLLGFLSAAVPGLLETAVPEITTLGLAEEDTVVIGKLADLKDGVRPGERTLDLPDKGNPKANWAQNSSKLRDAMAEGKPIRDASAGKPGSNTGFLRAERNLLQEHGWTLRGDYWYAPGK